MTEAPVLFADAGPGGLSLAAVLAEADLPVVVLEAEPQLPTNLRASMLASLGVGG